MDDASTPECDAALLWPIDKRPTDAQKMFRYIELARSLERRLNRLQNVIDSRPAINAGLPESYIKWSQLIYAMDAVHTTETQQ